MFLGREPVYLGGIYLGRKPVWKWAACFPRCAAGLISSGLQIPFGNRSICGYIASMTRINSRAKGANAELEVARILQTVVNRVAINCGFTAPKIRRNVEQCQVGGEDLIGLPWYSIEIKRVEQVNVDKWWEQTLTQARRKAPGATSWDALAKHGWKRIAADAAAEAQAGLGQVEAARGASGEAAGLEAARAASGDVGSTVLAGGGSMSAREVLREAGSSAGLDALRGYLAAQAGNEGRPLPAWAVGGSLGLDRSHGGPVVGPALVGGPREALDGLTAVQWECRNGVSSLVGKYRDRNPVSSFVATRTEPSPCPTPSEGLNAEKQAPVGREPVLIWRTSGKPWNVRFLGTIVCTNGFKLASTIDTSLETWLDVLREDLGVRLRG